MKKDKDSLVRQISQLTSRIYELNDRIYEINSVPDVNISELRKAEKAKSKLVKNKDKLTKKLYEEVSQNESFLHD